MVLARVAGTVVSTAKEPRIEGIKLLLLEKIDVNTMKGKNDFVVAMDAVGAGDGEIVFFCRRKQQQADGCNVWKTKRRYYHSYCRQL